MDPAGVVIVISVLIATGGKSQGSLQWGVEVFEKKKKKKKQSASRCEERHT